MIKQITVTLLFTALLPGLAIATSDNAQSSSSSASSAISSSLNANRDGNIEHKEREHSGKKKKKKLSAEDQLFLTKFLIALHQSYFEWDVTTVGVDNIIKNAYFAGAKARPDLELILKFIEAIDANDQNTINNWLNVYPNMPVNFRDDRRVYILPMADAEFILDICKKIKEMGTPNCLGGRPAISKEECDRIIQILKNKFSPRYKQREYGFTPLMKVAAAGNKGLIDLFLNNEADVNESTELLPWMVDATTMIDVKKLVGSVANYLLDRDRRTGRISRKKESLSNMLAHRDHIELFRLTDELNAVSLAAIKGDLDLVELLQLANPKQSTLNFALIKLIHWSAIAGMKEARPLLKAMGIRGRPNVGNYPAIAQKLIEAMPYAEHTQRHPTHQEWPFHKALGIAMRFGTPALLQPILDAADQVEDIGINIDHLTCDITAGEKIGMLLSAKGVPDNQIFRQLERAVHNPEFLARLQRFVRMQDAAHTSAFNEHLIPPVARIVIEYATLTDPVRRHILGLRSDRIPSRLLRAAEEPAAETEEPLFGNNMTNLLSPNTEETITMETSEAIPYLLRRRHKNQDEKTGPG